MDKHELDIAVGDGDASWCSCTCGWVSSKTSEDEARGMWTTHVVANAFITTTTTTG